MVKTHPRRQCHQQVVKRISHLSTLIRLDLFPLRHIPEYEPVHGFSRSISSPVRILFSNPCHVLAAGQGINNGSYRLSPNDLSRTELVFLGLFVFEPTELQAEPSSKTSKQLRGDQ
ncbi:Hypothetical protein NTJ_14474 [Nesidiocoris tenuis]|uniref:Uncharacterized protein n=1 Tax=Nesidiocoris tenuis TaxID=355587 RepID=A0ABN7BD97_9HEMI|nr:Hypothetical protein NTJ_14474 [Nesidiocoris tenuis]